MNHFSKYAISKKHTLNIKGGAGGSQSCPTCGDGLQICSKGCGTVHRCENGRRVFVCAK